MRKLFLCFVFFAAVGFSQPNCSQALTITSAAAQTAVHSPSSGTGTSGCNTWTLTWSVTGFTAVTVQLEGSQDGSTFSALSGTSVILVGANPTSWTTSTGSNGNIIVARAYFPYVRVNITAVTGSGSISTYLLGYSGTTASTATGSGGGGGSTSFDKITSGTNTTATMTVGTGATMATSGTGMLTANGIRTYTVGTLPGSPATGQQAYVTDGTSATDCTAGSGSNKVLCGYTGSVWSAESGGGGGGGATISAPYASYSGSTYGPIWAMTPPGNISAWTWVNQGSATTDGTSNSLTINAPALSADSMKMLVQSAPATPYSVLARIQTNTTGIASNRCGINFRESSTGKIISFIIYGLLTGTPAYSFGVNVDKYTNATTYAGSSYLSGAAGPLMGWEDWLKIVDDGTNLKFSICGDNLNTAHCTLYATESRTDYMASGPNQIGFFADSINATYGLSCTLLDWTLGSS